MKKILPLVLLANLFLNCSKIEGSSTIDTPEFTVPDTKDIVMYEINIGSFSATGDINGITNRLNHLQTLGINTIWLMPIHPIGTVNSFGSPYCVKDYQGINPQLGNFNDIKNLVAAAHERNIAVILDWVANHTAWDHPWITEHPNWYTQDGMGNIIHPAGTNWTDVADLNFTNTDMRAEMIAAMKFWITEAGIDGFRCDAADLVPFDFWQQAITSLQSSSPKNLLFLAEGTRNDHFSAGFQMNFGWDFYNTVKSIFVSNGNAGQLYATHLSEIASVPSGKRKLRFTTNHDLSNELTPIGVFGTKKAALAASAATLFMNGTPLLYSGQEVGVSNPTLYTSGQPISWNANADMLVAYRTMLQFYSSSDVAKIGTINYVNHPDLIVFEKTLGDAKLLVIINSRASGKNLAVPVNLQGNWTNALNNQNVTLTGNLELTAHDYLILNK
ncbi:alpha-amylase family glycosyl hydrolase [Flavobacterium sp. UBA6135]|uniref:alpha-amylase family glycosyl hydrolase n=1 Tax=Flavobacterium sp. UBA6135 TaxID=1946553 RepID=UPI0025BE9CBC|nr:alpha-amylase family glycosyl hydrolase [Flavobacterium sp. UBA6135]